MKGKWLQRLELLIVITVIFNTVITAISFNVYAQAQIGTFSGNQASSYQCFDKNGNLYKDQSGQPLVPTLGPDDTGSYYCETTDGKIKAVLKPPALQELEYFFVKILYVIWAVAAGLSFVFLIAVGYDYLLRGGTSDEELVKLRKRILNYILGLVLVFLAVPILTTVFRLLGVNSTVSCYNVNMPGFKFFYASLCTDPNQSIVSDPCSVITNSNPQSANGYPCAPDSSQTHTCANILGIVGIGCYVCLKQNDTSVNPPAPANTWEYKTVCFPGSGNNTGTPNMLQPGDVCSTPNPTGRPCPGNSPDQNCGQGTNAGGAVGHTYACKPIDNNGHFTWEQIK